ncbi:uncharacterized protein LOC105694158 [Orussus abietinus]|uniref:uncharacterized protein LOC105694158 n=1 Tax=Orussus abietinus TaxID=222816 RepID=UPI00062677B8|nr:uncharacterized protein LOC105694158 [Orussus abietinus]
MAKKKFGNRRKRRRRRVRKPRPLKIAALIVSAINDLREMKGSTPRKIIDYISYASNMSQTRIERQVKSALKRGVNYGILRRYRGHYFLPTGDELERANRIAVRFAKLPNSGLPTCESTLIAVVQKLMPTEETVRKVSKKVNKRTRGFSIHGRKASTKTRRKLRRTYSLPISVTPSISNKVENLEGEISAASDID